MCCRKIDGLSEQDAVQECSSCGLKDFVMHQESERVLCDRCYRVRQREQRDDDLILPAPGYDIEEVGRQ